MDLEKHNYPKASENNIFVFDLYFHIVVLAIVLYILFIAVVEPTSRKGINDMIIKSIDLINYGEICTPLSPECIALKLVLTNNAPFLNNLKEEYNDKPNKFNDMYNESIIITSGAVIFTLVAGLVFGYYIMSSVARQSICLKKIIITNIILFSIVGCIQAVFFLNFAMNYVPSLPSDYEKNNCGKT